MYTAISISIAVIIGLYAQVHTFGWHLLWMYPMTFLGGFLAAAADDHRKNKKRLNRRIDQLEMS